MLFDGTKAALVILGTGVALGAAAVKAAPHVKSGAYGTALRRTPRTQRLVHHRALADRDGELEILYSAATYPQVQRALLPDSVVAVQSRLNGRDGNVSLVGQELAVVDMSSAERSGKPP
ncbi:hypothetical protein PV396_04195 [Streptomyces sp. ME02-8801-2C]|uniref:hypothetical protein n=1 Tax=Streptomyces sp. ME02-8801-2C TaxID=3028680 RepID=UPI0029ADF702|nr:hypothetical protein [Streptomyces sp. ME02-8801-2C]MDX3451156.1 hypothetical protein [Streptomyces sp. ME02-8801-2C]